MYKLAQEVHFPLPNIKELHVHVCVYAHVYLGTCSNMNKYLNSKSKTYMYTYMYRLTCTCITRYIEKKVSL